MSDVRLGKGGELSITPSSGSAPNVDPVDSYRASSSKVYLGGPNWIADVTPDLVTMQLVGAVNAPRPRRVTEPDTILGPSAIALRAGRSASAQLRLSDAVETALGGAAPILWIERHGWVDAIPVRIGAAPIQSPRSGIQGVALGLLPSQGGFACSGVAKTDGSQRASTGIIGYRRQDDKITVLSTTPTNATATNPIVVAPPADANNTAPAGSVGLVAMGGIARGMESLTLGRTGRPREVPGGQGQIGYAEDPFPNWDLGLVCDSNEVHDFVLRDANGTRRRYQALLRAKDGDPEYSGEAILRVALTIDMTTDRASWNVALLADGRPLRTDQT